MLTTVYYVDWQIICFIKKQIWFWSDFVAIFDAYEAESICGCSSADVETIDTFNINTTLNLYKHLEPIANDLEHLIIHVWSSSDE